jgi:hypothetical protein
MEEGRKQVALQWKKTKKVRTCHWNWADLPTPAVDVILDKLNLYDYVNFAAVCVSWRSTALDNRNHRRNVKKNQPWNEDHQLPLLMIPNCFNSAKDRVSSFYSVTQKSLIVDYRLDAPLYKNRLIGSSFGWFISVDTSFSIALSNPFSPSSPPIHLPPVLNPEKLREDNLGFSNSELFGCDSVRLFQRYSWYYIAKAILSADPRKDCVVVVIYGLSKKLAFIRYSASAITPPRWIYMDSSMLGFSDVIYSKLTGLFHAVLGKTGEVCSIKIHERGDGYDCRFTSQVLEIEGKRADHHYLRYIVETCEGDLLQVIRSMKACKALVQVMKVHHIQTRSFDFKVYKLNEKGEDWREVTDLGDNVLFLGDSASVSVAPSQFPKSFFRPGSIYFLLPYFFHLLFFGRQIYVSDMGVANLQDKPGGAQPFRLNLNEYITSEFPPIWIIPTFQGTPRCKKS